MRFNPFSPLLFSGGYVVCGLIHLPPYTPVDGLILFVCVTLSLYQLVGIHYEN